MNFTNFFRELGDMLVSIFPFLEPVDPDWEGVRLDLVELFLSIKESLEEIGYSEVRMKSTTATFNPLITIFASSVNVYGHQHRDKKICQISMLRGAEARIFDKLAEKIVLKNLVDYAMASNSAVNVRKVGDTKAYIYIT